MAQNLESSLQFAGEIFSINHTKKKGFLSTHAESWDDENLNSRQFYLSQQTHTIIIQKEMQNLPIFIQFSYSKIQSRRSLRIVRFIHDEAKRLSSLLFYHFDFILFFFKRKRKKKLNKLTQWVEDTFPVKFIHFSTPLRIAIFTQILSWTEIRFVLPDFTHQYISEKEKRHKYKTNLSFSTWKCWNRDAQVWTW